MRRHTSAAARTSNVRGRLRDPDPLLHVGGTAGVTSGECVAEHGPDELGELDIGELGDVAARAEEKAPSSDGRAGGELARTRRSSVTVCLRTWLWLGAASMALSVEQEDAE